MLECKGKVPVFIRASETRGAAVQANYGDNDFDRCDMRIFQFLCLIVNC